MSFARWLNARLISTDRQGKRWPPGSGRVGRWTQPDDTQVTITSDGDALDLYVGRDKIYNVTLTPLVARQLAWWVLRWWMLACCFGIKTGLWSWTQRRLLDEQQREQR